MRKLFDYLPSSLQIRLKNTHMLILIGYHLIIGGYKLIPPHSMRFIGGGNYLIIAYNFLSLFKELADLRPQDKVLDVGCGTGRLSVPFTKYLSSKGEYHGFDIVKSGIDLCNEKISRKYPNFHYLHANIYNKSYNPQGIINPSGYHFPYEDEQFDFVFLTSVFTHMLSDDIRHYLSEISRVLKKDGKCFITYFLINDESKEIIKNGHSSQNIKFQIDDNSFTKNKEMREAAIGVKEEFIRKIYKTVNLKIKEPIYYGSWCNRENAKSYQDIIIAEKCKS